MIILDERHLKRLLGEYVRYYHADRTHLGLAKQTPAVLPEVPSVLARDWVVCIIATILWPEGAGPITRGRIAADASTDASRSWLPLSGCY